MMSLCAMPDVNWSEVVKHRILIFIFFLCFSAANGFCQYYEAVIKVPIAGVHERPNGTSPLLTQALLNEKIEIIRESGSFIYAKVPDGYTGYIKISDITTNLSSVAAEGNKVIVKTKFAAVYDSYGKEIYKAPMSSVFFGYRNGNNYEVILPENVVGYINEENAFSIPKNENIPLKDRMSFIESAWLFIGTKYLWGGCSANGIDCSGLTYIAAKLNGLKIPRDSRPQSKMGNYVDLVNAVPGDQLFFGADSKKTQVTHTGIYLGNGNFIHSSVNGVVINNIYNSEHFMSRFMFANNYFYRNRYFSYSAKYY
jgi:gamma-D-glutamyl-L-lysine dipeptidyl-peptidase